VLNNILDNVKLEEVREGIFSVLSEAERGSDYDKKVRVYDAIVGNRFYNRLIWGNWPTNYNEFCKECLDSASGGTVLDAGCGSLVFTVQAYAESTNKSVVLFDRSLGMLERARKRLVRLCGSVPKHITFIQGDIFELPFHNSSFDLVMSQGLLHMFDNKEALLIELERVRKEVGILSFTSLVGNNFLGKKYLSLLEKSGEVAGVYSTESLSTLLEESPFKYNLVSTGNVVYAKNA